MKSLVLAVAITLCIVPSVAAQDLPLAASFAASCVLPETYSVVSVAVQGGMRERGFPAQTRMKSGTAQVDVRLHGDTQAVCNNMYRRIQREAARVCASDEKMVIQGCRCAGSSYWTCNRRWRCAID